MAKTDISEKDATTVDYLESALDDLNEARQHAQEDLRMRIDSAISRAREALDQLRSDVGDRTEHMKSGLEDRAAEWQRTLDEASEDARRELGLRGVRAQRSEDALEALSDEIKKQKQELKA